MLCMFCCAVFLVSVLYCIAVGCVKYCRLWSVAVLWLCVEFCVVMLFSSVLWYGAVVSVLCCGAEKCMIFWRRVLCGMWCYECFAVVFYSPRCAVFFTVCSDVLCMLR